MPGTLRGNIFTEVVNALHADSQQTANEIANTTRNGCFEHCDGWPQELAGEEKEIILGAIALSEQDEVDSEAKASLLERVKRYREVSSEVEAVCRAECPTGGFGLFENDGDLFDDAGKPVIRTCPINSRLREVVINFAIKS